MSFHDIDFPLSLAFGASGGPVRAVEVVELANGREARNTAQSRLRMRGRSRIFLKPGLVGSTHSVSGIRWIIALEDRRLQRQT